MKSKRKILPLLLTAVMIIGLLPATTALADAAGDFDVTGGVLGVDFTYSDGVLTFVNPGDYTVSMLAPGATTGDRIYVNSTSGTKITLNGVNIDVSAISGACAFDIDIVSTVEIAVSGSAPSVLKSGAGKPGIRVVSNVSLTLTGDRTLRVYGGLSGAGIGGGTGENSGVININTSGIIETHGGGNGAGIGGGDGGSNGTVRIYNGDVRAYDGAYGAGIGGGNGGNGGNIYISGGTVLAQSVACGAGIGGGSGGSGTMVDITGGTINALGGPGGTGQGGGAGIGGGAGGGASGNIYISGGTVTASGNGDPGGNGGAGIGGGNYGNAQNITIAGGTVTAIGGQNASGLGGGRWGTESDIYIAPVAGTFLDVYAGAAAPGYRLPGSPFSASTSYEDESEYFHSEAYIPGFTVTGGAIGTDYTYNYSSGILTITSGTAMTVSMTSPGTTTNETIAVAAGVNANITLSGVSIDASGTTGACALKIEDSSTGNVNITLAGDNTLRSGADCAGLQKNGSGAGVGTLTIGGSGSLNANGGSRGAGIGGGSGGSASYITIAGDTLTATGTSGGAGVGGGSDGNASYITIAGGTVTATGTSGGAGVGRGAGGSGSNIFIEPPAAKQMQVHAGTSAGTATELAGSPFLSRTEYRGVHAYFYLVTEPTPELIVTGGVKGTDYTYVSGVLTFTKSGTYTVSMVNPGSTTNNTIVIAAGVNANITLNGVSIDVSDTNNACAFKIEDDSTGNVNLTLTGSNTLISGEFCAGLQKNGVGDGVGTLAIGGTGSLTATGGQGGAGIGGGVYSGVRNITITRGTINATTYGFAAGIGGGYDGDASYINISGGTVNASAQYLGAGIGGGNGGNGSYITISGGTVTAQGGTGSAGIGGGARRAVSGDWDVGSGSHITISGGVVTTYGGGVGIEGGYSGAGIGGGGDIYANGSASYITISGGTVTAVGYIGGAAIGGGNGIAGSNIMIDPPAWYSIEVNVGADSPGAPLAGSPFTTAAAYTGTDRYFYSVGTMTETPVTGLPDEYEMYTGGRVTWEPQPDGGTWDWDASYLSATFNSPATFTALRAGTTIVTYTAGGSQSVIVTIRDSGLPSTGQDFTLAIWLLIAGLCVGLCAISGFVVLRIRLRRKERA